MTNQEAKATMQDRIDGILKKLLCEENLKIKPNIRPGHGPCCTCQVCGYHYDECNCRVREIIKNIAQAKKELYEAVIGEINGLRIYTLNQGFKYIEVDELKANIAKMFGDGK